MSKIYKQNPDQGFSQSQAFISEEEKEKGQEELKGGVESIVRSVDVIVSVGSKTRTLTQSFIRKDNAIVSTFQMLKNSEDEPLEDPGIYVPRKPTWEESKPEIIKNVNEQVEKNFSKMMALKKINGLIPKGEHKFNLPNTVRLMEDRQGIKSLLISDISKDGFEIFDLSNSEEYEYDPESINIIRETIEKDLVLAEKNGIALSISETHPLDTWFLIINTKTGEKKVMILDVGMHVIVDAEDYYIKVSHDTVSDSLAKLKIGEKTKNLSEDVRT